MTEDTNNYTNPPQLEAVVNQDDTEPFQGVALKKPRTLQTHPTEWAWHTVNNAKPLLRVALRYLCGQKPTTVRYYKTPETIGNYISKQPW